MKQILQTENSQNNNKKEPITVDFETLKNLAPDTKGWLHFKNIDLSYPVVKTDDNSFYLSHLPDKSENEAGSIFVDYRCENIKENNNFIIYGHNMKNDTMFGLLDEYYNQEFYEKNSCFYYITEEKTYNVEILAGAVVDTNSDIYKVNLNEKKFEKIIRDLIKNSTFKTNKKYNPNDKIITLSTCGGTTTNARYVLIGAVK